MPWNSASTGSGQDYFSIMVLSRHGPISDSLLVNPPSCSARFRGIKIDYSPQTRQACVIMGIDRTRDPILSSPVVAAMYRQQSRRF